MRQILKISLLFLGDFKKYKKIKLIIKIYQFNFYILLNKKLSLRLTKREGKRNNNKIVIKKLFSKLKLYDMKFAVERNYLKKTIKESPFKPCEASISFNLRNTGKKNWNINTWEVKKFLATPSEKKKKQSEKEFQRCTHSQKDRIEQAEA